MKNAAETLGLDYANLLGTLGELDDAWRDDLEVLSGLVKGQIVIIIDDTVDHNAPGEVREPPRELLDLLPHPREVREGRVAPHGRHSGPLHGQDVHGGGFPLHRQNR